MTPRARLKPLAPLEAAAILDALNRSDTWAPDYPSAQDREVAEHLEAGTFPFASTTDPWGPWLVIDCGDGLVVGGAGFHGAPDEVGTVEIGYNVVPSRRGRGLATAAVALLIDVAAEAGALTLTAGTDPANVPSQRALASNGFIIVGRESDEFRWSRPLVPAGAPRARHLVSAWIKEPDTRSRPEGPHKPR